MDTSDGSDVSTSQPLNPSVCDFDSLENGDCGIIPLGENMKASPSNETERASSPNDANIACSIRSLELNTKTAGKVGRVSCLQLF